MERGSDLGQRFGSVAWWASGVVQESSKDLAGCEPSPAAWVRRWWRPGQSASAGSRHVTPPRDRPASSDSPAPASLCQTPLRWRQATHRSHLCTLSHLNVNCYCICITLNVWLLCECCQKIFSSNCSGLIRKMKIIKLIFEHNWKITTNPLI